MKKFPILFAVLVVATFALCACGSMGGISKAFEKEGYIEVTDKNSAQEVYDYLGGDYKNVCTVRIFRKGGHSATILEFKSEGELNKKLETDEFFKSLVVGSVNGNCVFLMGSNDARQIFVGVK